MLSCHFHSFPLKVHESVNMLKLPGKVHTRAGGSQRCHCRINQSLLLLLYWAVFIHRFIFPIYILPFGAVETGGSWYNVLAHGLAGAWAGAVEQGWFTIGATWCMRG